MARDNRKIVRAVRITTRTAAGKPNTAVTFKPGQEDELAGALTQAQLDHYKAKGAIEGDWASTREESATPAEATPPADATSTGEGEGYRGLDDETMKKLEAAFASEAEVAAATDEQLLAIEGVGKKTLEKIRAAFPPAGDTGGTPAE